MKRVKFSKEALLSLDAILCEMGITPHEDSNTNDEFDGTIIGYDGEAINIEEALSLFDIHSSNLVSDERFMKHPVERKKRDCCSRCDGCDKAEYHEEEWYCTDCEAPCNEIGKCPWSV
jgi:hypothetical protein